MKYNGCPLNTKAIMNAGTWNCKDLGGGAEALNPLLKIREAYVGSRRAKGTGPDFAVFVRHDLVKNAVTAFFTPPAAQLSLLFDATPCEHPDADRRMTLLVGDARAWEAFFPGYKATLRMVTTR